MDKLIFIVGFGRSGTTLLQSMLNAHSEIACPPESHFVKNYLVAQSKGKLPSFKTKDDLVSHLENDKSISRLRIDVGKIVQNLDLEDHSFTSKLFLELMEVYLKRKNKKHLGEKDPLNIGYLDTIKEAFPDAYIVHILRDPRDVIASRIRTGWGSNYPFAIHIVEYNHFLKRALAKGPALFNDRYIDLTYENLIEDSGTELKRICDMLKVPYEEEMLHYYKNSDELVAKDEMQWKENIFKPVIKTNKEKWKKEFSSLQVSVVETGTRALMDQLNYKRSKKPSGFIWLWIQLTLTFWKLAYWIRIKFK